MVEGDNCGGPCSSYDAVRVNDRDCLVEKQTMCTPSQQLRAWEKNVKPNLCGQPSPLRAAQQPAGRGGSWRGGGWEEVSGKDGELENRFEKSTHPPHSPAEAVLVGWGVLLQQGGELQHGQLLQEVHLQHRLAADLELS